MGNGGNTPGFSPESDDGSVKVGSSAEMKPGARDLGSLGLTPDARARWEDADLQKAEFEYTKLLNKVEANKKFGWFLRHCLGRMLFLGAVLGAVILLGLLLVFGAIVSHIIIGTPLDNINAAWAILAVVGAFGSVAGFVFGRGRKVGKVEGLTKRVLDNVTK